MITIYIYIHDAKAEAENKTAFNLGYHVGGITRLMTYASIIGGALANNTANPGGTGNVMVTPDGYEVYIGGDAAVAGGMPVIPDISTSNKNGEGEADSKIPQKAKDALDKIDKDPDAYLEDYNGNYPFKDQPNKAK